MKQHGNTGNQHAFKGDKAKSSTIALRCTKAQKQALRASAEKSGKSLSTYILSKLF